MSISALNFLGKLGVSVRLQIFGFVLGVRCTVLQASARRGKKRSAASPERPSQDGRLRAPHIEESKPVVVLKKRLLPY